MPQRPTPCLKRWKPGRVLGSPREGAQHRSHGNTKPRHCVVPRGLGKADDRRSPALRRCQHTDQGPEATARISPWPQPRTSLFDGKRGEPSAAYRRKPRGGFSRVKLMLPTSCKELRDKKKKKKKKSEPPSSDLSQKAIPSQQSRVRRSSKGFGKRQSRVTRPSSSTDPQRVREARPHGGLGPVEQEGAARRPAARCPPAAGGRARRGGPCSSVQAREREKVLSLGRKW